MDKSLQDTPVWRQWSAQSDVGFLRAMSLLWPQADFNRYFVQRMFDALMNELRRLDISQSFPASLQTTLENLQRLGGVLEARLQAMGSLLKAVHHSQASLEAICRQESSSIDSVTSLFLGSAVNPGWFSVRSAELFLYVVFESG